MRRQVRPPHPWAGRSERAAGPAGVSRRRAGSPGAVPPPLRERLLAQEVCRPSAATAYGPCSGSSSSRAASASVRSVTMPVNTASTRAERRACPCEVSSAAASPVRHRHRFRVQPDNAQNSVDSDSRRSTDASGRVRASVRISVQEEVPSRSGTRATCPPAEPPAPRGAARSRGPNSRPECRRCGGGRGSGPRWRCRSGAANPAGSTPRPRTPRRPHGCAAPSARPVPEASPEAPPPHPKGSSPQLIRAGLSSATIRRVLCCPAPAVGAQASYDCKMSAM
ncbi:hypothetical protein STANM309S_02679 [Streptomyces tanashiensis]